MTDMPTDRGIVLLVDDSPESLRMLIDALEGAGFTALVAREGFGALRLLERVEPDVILLDAIMPEMDGFDLCARIKAIDKFASTPVLFMTGLDDSEHILRGLAVGGVDYIVKPINPHELIARITRHMANARLIADARTALDASGAAIAAFGEDGSLHWRSEKAESLLEDMLGSREPDVLLSCKRFRAWLVKAAQTPLSDVATFSVPVEQGHRHLEIAYAGKAASGTSLCRLTVETTGKPQEKLSQTFGISLREGEVLLWLARGKSNRDIADILGISPRTITKHTEQILLKLNVENRTSAAILALKRCGI